MKVTRTQLEKIDVYLGLSRDVAEKLKEWIALNPSDPFDENEFIDLMHQEEITI